MTSENLKGNETRALIKKFLGSVNRSAGSSGFLKDLMVERYDLLDAMVNYEAMMIEANQALVAQGREPLYAIYPVDGLTIADSPLAFVNKGEADKETGPAYTLAEIGDELNMSRERVRQIEAEALAKLRLSPELRKLQSFLE